jgi:hypothetical protein
MALLLGNLGAFEQVELDASGDSRDGGLAGLARGEVAGLLGRPAAGAVRAVADEEAGLEDFQQERGQRQVQLVRGKAAIVSVAAARACGKLIRSGGMPMASAPAPMSWQMAW